MVVTPKDFAATLHGGAPVAAGRPDLDGAEPFSWRGALYVVDAVLRELGQPAAAGGVAPAQREALDTPGYVASLVPELRAREQAWLSEGEGAILSKEEPLRERERELRDRIAPIAEERRGQLDRLAAFIVENPNGAAIAKRVEHDARAEAEWRREAAERLGAIRAQIADHTLDSPLDPADWAALRDALDGDRHARWTVEWTSRNSDFPVMLVEQRTSLLDLAGAGLTAAVVELAADYQGDPDLQGLVPPHLARRARAALARADRQPPAPHRRLPRRPPVRTRGRPAVRSAAVPDRLGRGDALDVGRRRRLFPVHLAHATSPRGASTRPKSASNSPDR